LSHIQPEAPKIALSEAETKVFDALLQVVRAHDLKLTLRVAGGWVRDKMLIAFGELDQMRKVDIDIALDTMLGREFAELVNAWLEEKHEEHHTIGVIQRNPEQSKHLETARMMIFGHWIDLVNLRTEEYATDSRIPTGIKIGTPLEDALRRDLTINACFYNINTGLLEDFTNRGLRDLRLRVVSTPLPPLTTLLDDPLRALRAIRFASRFNFRVDDALLRAIADPRVRQALHNKVSRERIGSEVGLMVASERPIQALGLICELGLDDVVWSWPRHRRVFRAEQQVVEQQPQAASSALKKRSANTALVCEEEVCSVDCDERDGMRWYEGHNAESSEEKTSFGAVSLGCLINLDSLFHHHFDGRLSHTEEETRIARFAALTAPVAPLRFVSDKKGNRELPLAKFMLQEELRMRAKDVDLVCQIHATSIELKTLLREYDGLAREAATNTDAADALRLRVARILRKIGAWWKIALQIALITELSPAAAARTYSQGVSVIPDNCCSSVVVERYRALEHAINCLNLDGVWSLSPILNGNEVRQVLPRVPKGPVLGDILQQLLEHQIVRPDHLVDKSSAEAWLCRTFPDMVPL